MTVGKLVGAIKHIWYTKEVKKADYFDNKGCLMNEHRVKVR
jgi:hypothetical protein